MLRELDEDGILADTLNHMPGDDEIVLFSPPEKPTAAGDNQSENPRVLAVKFKVAGIAKPCAVAEVDNLQPP